MRGNVQVVYLIILIILLLDFYVFQGVKAASQALPDLPRRIIYVVYWSLTVVTIAGILFFSYTEKTGRAYRSLFFAGIITVYFPKLIFLIFLFADDVQRLVRTVFNKIMAYTDPEYQKKGGISRSDFLLKAGLVIASVPLAGMLYGMIFGAHDYRVKKVKLRLKNLPSSFNGLRIAQISDIHTGSFYNKQAVERGVDLLIKQNADLVFFTGDLVNDRAVEALPFVDLFRKVKAPLGVFSVLGNHDYGEYYPWDSLGEKSENLERLKDIHAEMGWRLMVNENHIIQREDGKVAIIGIENWGKGKGWPKYGRLDIAYKGTEAADVKILLSHDPSHWDAQVREGYKDIDLTLSGHTHGFQFGVEIAGVKWSPVKYVYKQWAGLYQEGNQYLYVNRGFGFLGFPGRIGMPPEITVIELEKA